MKHQLATPRFYHALLSLILSLVLTGCSSIFIAPYDEATDKLLTDLTVHTETAVASADLGKLTQTDQDKFYAESVGTVQTMEMRASLYDKNEKEMGALADLKQRYLDLRDHHLPPRTSLSTGLRATLLDVHQIQAAKKRSTAFTSGLKKPTQ